MALLLGGNHFCPFWLLFLGRDSRGHQPRELVNAPLELKSTQRPERRTMHGIQQSSQLGQRLPVHSCVLRKKAEANHGAVHPPHLTKPISGTGAPDGQSLEMLSSIIPTHLPTYLLAHLKRNNAVPQTNALSNHLMLHLRTKSQAHF